MRAQRTAGILALLLVTAAAVAVASEPEAVPPAPSATVLGGTLPGPFPLFPATNWWNLDITNAPLDANSAAFIAFIGGGGTWVHPDFGGIDEDNPPGIYGFPYAVVDGTLAKKTVTFVEYPSQSDGVGVPFYPVPDEAITQVHWIEGGAAGSTPQAGDRHLLMVDRDNKHLYELYSVEYNTTLGRWEAGSGAFWDMNVNGRRPEGWTSADASGMAIFPGLVRYDEADTANPDEIEHAFRVTVQATNGYVYPASHVAGNNPSALPMGARLRLKATTDISGYAPLSQKIFRAMKKYGLIVADNGSNMYVSGTHDTRWDNGILNPDFHDLHASDFEVIQLGWNPPPSSAASIGDVTVTEGNFGTVGATFTVTLSQASETAASVQWSTGLAGSAASGIDYVAASGTLTFPAGFTSRTLTAPVVGDLVDEGNETFYVNLANPDGMTLLDGQAKGTITDDDPSPTLSFTGGPLADGDRTVTEGNTATVNATFAVSLSAPSGRVVKVNFATGTSGNATSGVDYAAKTGVLTFNAGETNKTFTIQILADTAEEVNELFYVNLSAASNATILDGQAQGTIVDNDPPPAGSPSVSISNSAVAEGDTGFVNAVFTVSLSAASANTVTVPYATGTGGTATSGVDYTFKRGTLTFTPGQTVKTVNVAVLGDVSGEADETFYVNLTSAAFATIADGQGAGTIDDNDPPAAR